jgi:hypothetical protein
VSRLHRGGSGRARVLALAVLATALVRPLALQADVSIDIRVDGVLTGGSTTRYVAAVDDCADLVSLQVSAGTTNQQTLSVSDARASSGTGCEFTFEVTGDTQLSPQVVVNLADGTSESHGETFELETTQPDLAFQSVSLSELDGRQHLIVSATASDLVDISYVGFSVLGLRASALRAAGGVVERARAVAFLEGSLRGTWLQGAWLRCCWELAGGRWVAALTARALQGRIGVHDR